MKRTNEQKLFDALRSFLVAQEDVRQAASAIMKQPDVSETLQNFQHALFVPLDVMTSTGEAVRKLQVKESLDQLAAVIKYRTLDTTPGTSEWRAIYDEKGYVVKSVLALRTQFPVITIGEAKYIVEAYRDGLML